MNYEDEKDYIMRLIKAIARVLINLIFGRQPARSEEPSQNPYGISGGKMEEIKAMVDRGEMNEAENTLLDDIDLTDREAVAALIFFYEYTGAKDPAFLNEHRYSQEEALEGLKQLAARLGYQNVTSLLEI
ncbi:MAG: hypothetical protein HFH35_13415 [Eubacterium sp.]|nr:hypothetical protein [Eubacterium sp.]